jgi:hypothetical protein
MTPTDSAGAGSTEAGNPPDALSAGAGAAPLVGAAETIQAEHPGAENTGVERTSAESTDRPGDIPYDQAAAEHENPALE